MAGPGNVVQPEILKVADAGRLSRRPLPQITVDLGAPGVPEMIGRSPARAVEMRLDDLEDKPGGHRRIECVRRALGWPSRSVEACQWVELTIPKVPRNRDVW